MNMNFKRIRIFTRNAILIVLSMIVLACVTGLSYKAHYCHGSLSGIAFYTEFGIQAPVSCGCKEDASVKIFQETNHSPVLKKRGCCSNISFFSKLNIESLVNYVSALSVIQPFVVDIVYNTFRQDISETKETDLFEFTFRPPPLAGRKLVLFLSQQRIPLISYNC